MLGHWAGTLAVLAWILWQFRRLQRLKKNVLTSADANICRQFAEVARQPGVRRLPAFVASREFDAPIAFGLFRPVVLLPAVMIEKLPEARAFPALGSVG